ncbi:MAG: endolytic transglycosylase MltG [Clostridia bacterium]
MIPLARTGGRARASLRWGIGAVLVAALVVLGGLGAWRYFSSAPAPQARTSVVVTVKPGATARDVADLLQQAGVIRSAWAFLILSARGNLDARLRPGSYRMSPAWSLATVLQHLAHDDILVYRVTIPEGFTVHDIVRRLVASGVSTRAALEAALKTGVPGMTAPKGVRTAWEGFLFPDTYLIPYGSTPAAVVRMMWQDFESRTQSLRRQLPPGEGVWTWVTLASIVQAEDKRPADAPLIAAVFSNRLAIGMPLQSDATVRYALDGRVAGALSLKDLTVASPYNTYLNKGLPPGPIDCPGMVALRAALHPAHVGYLYFVATPSGQDLFADTYQQHEQNVARVAAMQKGGS